MNKPLHYAIAGAVLLFIGLYIPFHLFGGKDGSFSFTKATDYSFTSKGNPSARFSSSFHSVAPMPYSAPSSVNGHSAAVWSNPAQDAMTMPLNFKTTKWTPSAPNMFVEQEAGGTFVAAANAGHTLAHSALAVAQPTVRRNSNNATNSSTAAASAAVSQADSKTPVVMRAPRYTAHQSTVQEPFNNDLPSESNTSFTGSTPDGISNRKNGFINPSDPGNRSEESPVGEPWIMLIFAAAAAAIITLRKRQPKAQA